MLVLTLVFSTNCEWIIIFIGEELCSSVDNIDALTVVNSGGNGWLISRIYSRTLFGDFNQVLDQNCLFLIQICGDVYDSGCLHFGQLVLLKVVVYSWVVIGG